MPIRPQGTHDARTGLVAVRQGSRARWSRAADWMDGGAQGDRDVVG